MSKSTMSFWCSLIAIGLVMLCLRWLFLAQTGQQAVLPALGLLSAVMFIFAQGYRKEREFLTLSIQWALQHFDQVAPAGLITKEALTTAIAASTNQQEQQLLSCLVAHLDLFGHVIARDSGFVNEFDPGTGSIICIPTDTYAATKRDLERWK